MALISSRPTSPGRRFVVSLSREGLSKQRPVKSLLAVVAKKSGRNSAGRISVRHKGGGHKKLYRVLDFKRNKDSIPAIVEGIEYDPFRTANIALIRYADGVRSYIIAPKGLQEGASVMSGSGSPLSVGNAMAIRDIPVGAVIHAIELKPGKGAQLARSAGAYVQLMAKDGDFAVLRMKSGEVRKVPLSCKATIGEVGNSEHNLISLGKAGASRRRGVRPTVRGVSMNPVDHPHGGGEGRTSGGRHPCTPWGKPTKGYKTRNNKRTDSLIMRRRKV